MSDEYGHPTLKFWADRDKRMTFTRLSGTLDWTAWTTVKVWCPGLSVDKTCTVTDADNMYADFTNESDWSGQTPGVYDYQVLVIDGGGNEYVVGNTKGKIDLRAAIA
jgi:hypothetical protein